MRPGPLMVEGEEIDGLGAVDLVVVILEGTLLMVGVLVDMIIMVEGTVLGMVVMVVGVMVQVGAALGISIQLYNGYTLLL